MNFEKLLNPDFLTDNYGGDNLYSDLFVMSFYLTLSITVSWILVPYIVPRFYNKKIKLDENDISSYEHGKARLNIADLLHHQVYLYPLTYFVFYGSYQLYNTNTLRYYGCTWESYMGILIYVSGNLVHIPISLLKEGTLKYKIQMLLHHLISVLSFSYNLINNYLFFYACAASCCELSTIFLNQSFLYKEYTNSSIILAINGFCLWLSFIFLRLLLFPSVLLIYNIDYFAFEKNNDKLGIYLYNTFSITILFILSIFWTKNITKGMLKRFKLLREEYCSKKKD